LNFADFLTTWIGISSGKGVEANSFWIALGGPFSPPAIFVKLAVVPAIILGVAWGIVRKFEDPRLAIVTIIPATVVLAHAVANNVQVIAKKTRKIVSRGDPT
jgi:hypothetical protein